MSQRERCHISVVTPVYGCFTCLPTLYSRLVAALEPITKDFEIVMVNDCSPDDSWRVIEKICAADPRVKGINFSRNFGQHFAITAGLDYCIGDWVVVMDCDLQDRPEEIPRFYAKAQEGFDVVFGRRVQRQDNAFKRFTSWLFNRIMSFLVDQTLDPTTANFGIFRCEVIQSFRQIRERSRSFPMFIRWLGFRQAAIDVQHASREDGKSSYTFSKLLRFAATNVVAYSNKPLILSIYVGLLSSGLSFLFGVYFIYRYLHYGVAIEGWTSLMVSFYFIAGGLFATLGILGLYLGKIFDEAKNRPLYVISHTCNLRDGETSPASSQRSDLS